MICAITDPAAAMAAFNAEVEGIGHLRAVRPGRRMLAGRRRDGTGEATRCLWKPAKLIRALPDATEWHARQAKAQRRRDLALYKELAPNYGFEIIDKGISTGADLPMALDAAPGGLQLTGCFVVSYSPLCWRSRKATTHCSTASMVINTAALRQWYTVCEPAAWQRVSCGSAEISTRPSNNSSDALAAPDHKSPQTIRLRHRQLTANGAISSSFASSCRCSRMLCQACLPVIMRFLSRIVAAGR